ncbi:MAG TPA: hypothetical protein VIO33_26095 [Burkholderiaceae bacterium]
MPAVPTPPGPSEHGQKSRTATIASTSNIWFHSLAPKQRGSMRTMIRNLIKPATIANVALAVSLVAITDWGISSVRQEFDSSVTNDFAAAGLLAKIRLHGERMRRFEKEMFIYVANEKKREGYVSEHGDSYGKLLVDLDTALAPSGRAFTDAERAEMMKWKAAAAFYFGEFDRLANKARQMHLEGIGAPEAGRLSVEFNEQIKTGKDRFATLLNGAGEMRLKKEQQAQEATTRVGKTFSSMVWIVAGVVGVGGIGLQLLLARREREREQAELAGSRLRAGWPRVPVTPRMLGAKTAAA